MIDWVENKEKNNSERGSSEKGDLFSLASNEAKQPRGTQVTDSIAQKQSPQEAITQLGSSYEIKDVTVSKKETKQFPSVLLALIVILPIILIFTVSAISNLKKNKSGDSFLFNTLESKYFTLSVPSEYEVNSVIDKKIPYLERHTMTSNADGEKVLTIVIKDVKFEYDLSENKEVIARRDNPSIYSEEAYELSFKKGLYFKKTDENFEHLVLLVDRNRNLLYEIKLFSSTNFSNDSGLADELNSVLKGMTFL